MYFCIGDVLPKPLDYLVWLTTIGYPLIAYPFDLLQRMQ